MSASPPLNLVLIVADDHRYDAMGFLGHPFLHTPAMDRLAREGVTLTNACTTTALCSPSRASILTGQYAHRHTVVDNQHIEPPGTRFFPEYLQQAGYETAFFGKWHIGYKHDMPRPGFDHWVSFAGHGSYYPGTIPLNVDGKSVPQDGYITDLLTDYTTAWISRRSPEKPFFLQLSHKAPHSPFQPAERHRGRYADQPVQLPLPPQDPAFWDLKPVWLKNQQNSFHGIENMGYGAFGDMETLYRNYCETLLGVDESIGRVLQTLERKGLLENTLVVYTSDHGFCFGDQGTIDKRHAYEPAIRVPMLLRCPRLFEAGTQCSKVVANIDIGPTLLAAAGLPTPEQMDGRSFIEVARGENAPWRDALLYEYYWEWNYPYNPTTFALREERYKYIYYYGAWDVQELYDLRDDPGETRNLIEHPEHQERVCSMNRRLFAELERTGGLTISFKPNQSQQWHLRRKGSRPAGEFPSSWTVENPNREMNLQISPGAEGG